MSGPELRDDQIGIVHDATAAQRAAATRAVLHRLDDQRITPAEAATILSALGLAATAPPRGSRTDGWGRAARPRGPRDRRHRKRTS